MKTILYIGNKFYGYEKEIIDKLSEKYKVIFIDPTPSFFKFIILNLLKMIFGVNTYKKILLNEVNKKIKKETKKLNIKGKIKIDILFVIALKLYSKENFVYLENFYEFKIKKLYLWDDLNRQTNFFDYRDYFTEIYSFDKKDCIENNLKYRPTFYSTRLNRENNSEEYDISFVGIYNPKRDKFIEKIEKYYQKKFVHLYLNILVYFYKYFFNLNYNLKKIQFSKISREKYNDILQKSKIVIDIVGNNQEGVTQRVLDALYLEKKLITNHKAILEMDIYDEANILVINEEDSEEKIKKSIISFNKLEYKKLDKKKIEYYSLNQWVKEIFENI